MPGPPPDLDFTKIKRGPPTFVKKPAPAMLPVCDLCSAYVADEDEHTEWHARNVELVLPLVPPPLPPPPPAPDP